MNEIGDTFRSKLPNITGKVKTSEDSILLKPIAPMNYNTLNDNNNNVNENELVDGFENPNFKMDRDFSDTDLLSFHDRSNHNKIDEWQAGWNVTNAIQVRLFRVIGKAKI